MITSFTQEIVETHLLKGFFGPDVGFYAGTTDPTTFLSNLKYTMMNHECTPAHMCWVFPKYLKEDANTKFNTVPQNNISNFIKLAATLLGRFY